MTVRFFDEQDVVLEDVAALTDNLGQLAGQVGSLMLPGVITGLTVTCGAGYALTVAAGSALDPNGEILTLATSDTIGFVAADVGHYVVLRFAEGVPAGRRVDPATNRMWPAYSVDSYQLAVVTQASAGDVVLATISAIDIDGIATLLTGDRQIVGGRVGINRLTTVKLEDEATTGTVRHHIGLVGTGSGTPPLNPHLESFGDLGEPIGSTMAAHLAADHHHQLVTQDPYSRSAHVQPVLGSSNTLTADQIVAPDVYLVGGSPVSLIDPHVLVVTHGSAGGLMAVLLKNDGTLQTQQLLHYSGSRLITGVMPVDLDDTIPQPSNSGRTLALVKSGSVYTLSWDGGPAVTLDPPSDVSNGDQYVRLAGGTVASLLTVWVDYSALPGSSQSDTLIIDQYADETSYALLSVMFFAPNAAGGWLGHGEESLGGRALDKRSFGSISFDGLADAARNRLLDIVRTTRRNGIALGGALTRTSTAVKFWGAVCWIGGLRIAVGNQTITPGSTVSRYLYLDGSGTLTASVTDPSVDPTVTDYLRVGFVRTDGGGNIVFWRDERQFLRDVDRAPTLGLDSLANADLQQLPRLEIPQGIYGAQTGERRARTLVLHTPGTGLNGDVRLYATHWSFMPYGRRDVSRAAGFEFAINCEWQADSANGPCWLADNPNHDAFVFGLDAGGFYQVVLRHEDLAVGQAPSWQDVSVLAATVRPQDRTVAGSADSGYVSTPGLALSTWSSAPFGLDASLATLALRPTLIQDAQSQMTITGRDDLDAARYNEVGPQNMVRAWGVIDVYHVALANGDVEARARTVCGLNLGNPQYMGVSTGTKSNPNNTWRIPLLTRLVRRTTDRFTSLPDAIVIGQNVQENAISTAISQCTLQDDGKVTYVLIKGPVGSGPPIVEYSFTFGFAVIGVQGDEPLPDQEAVLGDGKRDVVPGRMTADSGFAGDRTPRRDYQFIPDLGQFAPYLSGTYAWQINNPIVSDIPPPSVTFPVTPNRRANPGVAPAADNDPLYDPGSGGQGPQDPGGKGPGNHRGPRG